MVALRRLDDQSTRRRDFSVSDETFAGGRANCEISDKALQEKDGSTVIGVRH
jgi:hypothetical protein